MTRADRLRDNINKYTRQANVYMTQASEELARGDLRQASEKAWGAVTQISKAVATQRGWRHGTRSSFDEIIVRVLEETGDDEFPVLFGLADQLHVHFYEGHLKDELVSVYVRQMPRYMEKMRGLLDGGELRESGRSAGPLVEAIETVKERIEKHGASLRENEFRTRVALIDPILAALGWDVSDPVSVTLEYDVQGRRADYALLQSGGKPSVMLEAKKLGENLQPHLMQMLNYANASGVDYAGLTDGSYWELYDVFKRGELSDRKLLSVSIAEAPAYESALKLLRLWRPNVESGEPQEAERPVAEVPAYPQTPQTTTGSREPDKIPSVTEEGTWTPITSLKPTDNNRPSKMSLPDGTIVDAGNWRKALLAFVEWLHGKQQLTNDKLPVTGRNGGTIANRGRRKADGSQMRTPIEAGATGIFVECEISGVSFGRAFRILLDQSEFDPDSLQFLLPL